MIAHIRKTDGTVQPLKEHCRRVALLCERAAKPHKLSKAAYLIGLLHDMGKATEEFERYLYSSYAGANFSSPHNHSPAGAIYIYRRYFCAKNASKTQRAAAQIFSMCIYGHHAGLSDCIGEHLGPGFLDNLEPDEKIHYEDALSRFFKSISSESELDSLFEEGQQEIEAFIRNIAEKQVNGKNCMFQLGMLTRLLLSILVDCDRWDSACFEYDTDSSVQTPDADWETLFEEFEKFRRNNLNSSDEIGKIRSYISDRCLLKASKKPGIYTLCVPTGGGKTYSSLRYALKHAALNGKKRVFYIIPYNTILDQNAQDIRKALSDYPSILEHHSNVIMPTQEEQENYRILTERWDSDIILTSLVQFLNACFSASNADARRLFRLTDSVLIFDEIQSLPKHCKTLFEQAITFLSSLCGSTVVLCTATQPKLELAPKPEELVENCADLFKNIKRVSYIFEHEKALHNGEAADKLIKMLETRSVLTIVNTKAVANDVYHEVLLRLPEAGMKAVFAEPGCTDEEIRLRAKAVAPNEVLCVHMSTLLCPAHRKQLITWLKIWLKENARVFCISTALIEAGINVSFPVVVRSLAGLPSIVQAAGRANRSMEYEIGDIYIWKFCDENLKYLADIQNGGNIIDSLPYAESSFEPDSPEQIDLFFSRWQDYINACKDYPRGEPDAGKPSLFSLLSDNERNYQNACGFGNNKKLILRQSFRTAYREFEVINQHTRTVIVPFGKGEELIAKLECDTAMAERRYLLKEAQAYSVSLPESTFKRLEEVNAVHAIGDTGVYSLGDGYYDRNSGVSIERGELQFLVY